METINDIKSKRDKGFTLVELLIVIVILGVLATVTVFAVSGITGRGEQAACKADMKTVEVATEAFYAQGSPAVYPASVAALVTAKFLKSAPAGTWAIDQTSGAVTRTPACT
jgi:general secretion pathway protein G